MHFPVNPASQNEINQNQMRGFLLITLLVLLFNSFILVFLYRNISFSLTRHEVAKLKKEKRELFLELENLRLAAAAQSTPGRIERLFREKYGYVPLEISTRIITLELPPVESNRP